MRHKNKTRAPFPKTLRPKIVPSPPSYKSQKESANFILVKLEPGTLEDCLRELENINGINRIHTVYGKYDLVLISGEKNEADRNTLLEYIRAVTGVVEVRTLIAAAS